MTNLNIIEWSKYERDSNRWASALKHCRYFLMSELCNGMGFSHEINIGCVNYSFIRTGVSNCYIIPLVYLKLEIRNC